MTHRLGAALCALALLITACGTPGGDSSSSDQDKQAAAPVKRFDPTTAGDVTLTVWDQEVRGGQAAQIKRLNKAFQAKYPNIRIKRVAKSFTDINTTLKLAVSGDKPPDVVEANQGRPIMGQLVKGGLLKPLDPYAKAYGWADRWSPTLLDLNRFSSDGAQFGSGNLYGVSQMGEIVGVFYNKTKVSSPPKTFAEFEQQVAEAKSSGDVPIAFGNLDKFPGIHEFQTVQNQYAPPQQVRDFVFAKDGASFATPENEQAAGKLQEWADKGYFTPKFNGTSYDSAWQQFAKGKGRFLIAGTWLTADLSEAMGEDVGFMLMPTAKPVSLGGESLPFAVTEKSANPDVAAAYIDFITNADAARTLVETDNLPAMPTDAKPATPLSQEVFAAWRTLNDQDGLVPYLDYATPSFYDDVTGQIQRLLAGREEPGPFTEAVQKDYSGFTDSLK